MAQMKNTTNSADERMKMNKLTAQIIGIAMKVHNRLGPGFVEKIYEYAMAYELNLNEIKFIEQGEIRVSYGAICLGYQRVDFIVESAVVVELKSVNELSEIHLAQMLSYLKTADYRVGLILNFAASRLQIKRMVNNY